MGKKEHFRLTFELSFGLKVGWDGEEGAGAHSYHFKGHCYNDNISK